MKIIEVYETHDGRIFHSRQAAIDYLIDQVRKCNADLNELFEDDADDLQ